MKNIIGIRREDLSKEGEKRVAITPSHAKKITEAGYRLFVQPGVHPADKINKRAYTDAQYSDAGATISEDLSEANVIFGLKEIETRHILPEKTYLFFSHTHKGQVKNREMLQTLVDRKNTVIDYELVADRQKGRIITAFTYFAGYAGMIDTLWTYGKRMKMRGINHPFEKVPQSIEKEDLELIKEMLKEIGEEITTNGTPAELPPFINCVLGKGKTSYGAQEIYDILPHEEISLNELKETFENGSRNQVYKLVLEVNEMFRLKADANLAADTYNAMSQREQMQHYFDHPEDFESNLEDVLPYISILMNCILWSPEYPRTISNAFMQASWKNAKTLEAIGDVTCDPNGSIEFSKETWINDPVFIFNPETGDSAMGFEGDGVAVMAVTNLPCEFAADASKQFSEDIWPVIDGILDADYNGDFQTAELPEEVSDAVILWKGEFTPRFEYMQSYLKTEGSLPS